MINIKYEGQWYQVYENGEVRRYRSTRLCKSSKTKAIFEEAQKQLEFKKQLDIKCNKQNLKCNNS